MHWNLERPCGQVPSTIAPSATVVMSAWCKDVVAHFMQPIMKSVGARWPLMQRDAFSMTMHASRVWIFGMLTLS